LFAVTVGYAQSAALAQGVTALSGGASAAAAAAGVGAALLVCAGRLAVGTVAAPTDKQER
jgi:hypothetical protein